MNTRTARSQLLSGLICGRSAALLEATGFDVATARAVNCDLQDCYLAVNADVEDVQVIMLPEGDHFSNPAGANDSATWAPMPPSRTLPFMQPAHVSARC